MNLPDRMDIETPQPHTKIVTISLIVSLFILIGLLGGSYAWAYQYHEKIGPNVTIDSMDLSGLDRTQAKALIQDRIDLILSKGLPITTTQSQEAKPLVFSSITGSDAVENLEFDIDQVIERAFQLSHESNPVLDTYRLIANTFTTYELTIPVVINEENVKQTIYSLFPNQELLAQDPTFTFLYENDVWTGTVTTGKDGTEFTFKPFFEKLHNQLEHLQTEPQELQLVSRVPSISNQQAQTNVIQAYQLILTGPVTFTYKDASLQTEQKWFMTERDISEILKPGKEGVEISQEQLNIFLDTIAGVIERPAQDARIDVENGRVTNFIQSKNGVELDRDAIYQSLVTLLQGSETTENPTISLVTREENPTVETGDVNDLGITQILGTGTSSYRGSPANRKANIKNGVRLLNGLLIPPGETFSLLHALQPFTLENGYLPELVIKGDKIQPEIAGGLCQIGTTTFRAVMNSGLIVAERRNHSLVVSYYNDPSNGKPGTDATIYDPAPDFKFTNDTGKYVLFQAENLVADQSLRFTLWGTSDGRKGSYTPPVISRWIPVGEKRITETTDLEPGKEQCQTPHIGADASFDYTVVKPDGTIQKTTFESHYRPLPEICLKGVEKLSTEVPETPAEETPLTTPLLPAELPIESLTP